MDIQHNCSVLLKFLLLDLLLLLDIRLFYLGTLLVSDVPPSNTENPLQNNSKCDEHSCIGRVWIYYSDSNEQVQWGTMDRSGIDVYARRVICRQLGYKFYKNTEISAPSLNDSSSPVWIKRAYCGNIPEETDDYYSNVLQCNPQICEAQECNHDNDLVISCCEYPYLIVSSSGSPLLKLIESLGTRLIYSELPLIWTPEMRPPL